METPGATGSRIERMKEKLLSSPYDVCIQRARLYTRSYQETEGQPPAIRAAKALAKTLAEMTIYICEEECIVGNRTSKRLAGVIPVERGDINAVLEMDMDTLLKRKRPFMISEDDRRALREEILPYWKGKTIRDKKATLWAERGLMKVKLLGEIDRNCPNLAIDIFDVQGHLVLGHGNVMRQGFSGIKERAHRFAGEAMKLAEKEADPGRRDELLRIADNCRWVPANPPRTFYEAMQCLWFTQVIAQISYGMAGTFALGRVDQYLYPFYKRDGEQGIITKEEALELIEELELKLTSNILLLPEVGLEVSSTLGTSPQPITIGGLTKDGKDATNELSWMILEASEKLKAVINNLAIRIHSKTAEDFMLRACRVYRSTSGQAFYNDEAIIPALLSDGYSLEDARDYAIVGCVEPTGSGDTFACTWAGAANRRPHKVRDLR